MSEVTPAEVVRFWRQAGPDKWWKKDAAFDRTVRSKFLALHEAASRGELADWEDSAEGALALIILFDQFPRNMFRGSPHAFATDPLARAVADRALARGFDRATDEALRMFFFMPFMHSETLADQDRCVALFDALGVPGQTEFATGHRDIIVRFGRFPHRNRIVGRETTAAEREFLDGGGFSG
ncbi:MAG: DUF924 domain-containing protein [Hyphomicrobiales bacterium]|nr:DUF924 domain-containing protein [Hyphomicrobiales bacterium]MDE2284624.1 DUF924 domain-containing protein [Hyphomicrobiales bacterium]MDE2375554.1 DUF924 domain-containing protein [Hyphomicrobiales bacterium]